MSQSPNDALTLVDSSTWIGFLRGDPAAQARLDPLMAGPSVRISGPIFTEVVSGARHRADQVRLMALLRKIPWLVPIDPIWERVAETRFALARLGWQCQILDIMIALTAVDYGATLLARDRDFERMVGVLPLDLEVF